MAATDLYDAMAEFFDACVRALDTTAAGAPECRYISEGPPAWDTCLVGESMVSTVDGPRMIRDLRPGDRVWAFDDGRLVERQVLHSGHRGVRSVYRIRSPRRSLVATEDHRVMRLAPQLKRTSQTHPQIWEREWVRVDELQRGDILVTADSLPGMTSPGELPDGTTLTPEVAWLLGLWVGDGYFDSQDGFCLAVYGDVRKRAEEILQKTWGLKLPYAPPDRIKVKSREMYGLFASIFPRRHAPEKQTPPLMWGRDPDVTRAYLQGYVAADGHVDRRGWTEYATSSPALARELRMLHVGLGDPVSNLCVQERPAVMHIAGNPKPTVNAHPLHRFTLYPDAAVRHNGTILDYRGARRAIPDEHLGVMVVGSVEYEGDAETYDIEVAESQSFVADGIIVHNCPCLIVHCGGPDIGQTFPLAPALATMHRVAVQGEVDLIVFTATILRCAPVIDEAGNLPTPAEHAAAAAKTSADLWSIWNVLKTEHRAETLFAPRSREFSFEPAIAVNPGGGCAGWQIPLRVQLGGYRAA